MPNVNERARPASGNFDYGETLGTGCGTQSIIERGEWGALLGLVLQVQAARELYGIARAQSMTKEHALCVNIDVRRRTSRSPTPPGHGASTALEFRMKFANRLEREARGETPTRWRWCLSGRADGWP
jgi:hypothetical protein